MRTATTTRGPPEIRMEAGKGECVEAIMCEYI